MGIYVQKDGEQHGPFSTERIRQGIQNGEFRFDDPGWMDGNNVPQLLSKLIEPSVPQIPKSSLSATGVLDHSVTASRSETFRSDVVVIGKIIGAVIFLTCLGLVLSEHYRDHRSEREKMLQEEWERLGGKGPYGSRPSSSPTSTTFGSRRTDQFNGFAVSSGAPMFNNLDQQLADRAREVAAKSSIQEKPVGLRNTREEFVRAYGEPFASSVKSSELTLAGFHHDDFTLMVWFWNNRAHEIKVLRKDGGKLTEEQMQSALAAFGGGGKWTEISRSGDRIAIAWKGEGKGAMLTKDKRDIPDTENSGPVDTLEIITDEYLHEITK